MSNFKNNLTHYFALVHAEGGRGRCAVILKRKLERKEGIKQDARNIK